MGRKRATPDSRRNIHGCAVIRKAPNVMMGSARYSPSLVTLDAHNLTSEILLDKPAPVNSPMVKSVEKNRAG